MNKKIWVSLFFMLFAGLFTGCAAQDDILSSEVFSEIATALESELANALDAALEESPEVQPAEPEESSEPEPEEQTDPEEPEEPEPLIAEDGQYTSKDDVALYIYTYGKLPSNYITKKDAQAQGWNNKENTMAEVLPGMSIGGDHFGNYEGLLPKESGRSYTECDIDYVKGSRNAKRIVFSNDGLIFYTDDHYNTFEQLY